VPDVYDMHSACRCDHDWTFSRQSARVINFFQWVERVSAVARRMRRSRDLARSRAGRPKAVAANYVSSVVNVNHFELGEAGLADQGALSTAAPHIRREQGKSLRRLFRALQALDL